MRRNSWHIHEDEASYTLARHWPPRFDVMATARFPTMRKGRLARQIRQDLWRALKGLRGFSPVVRIVSDHEGLTVTAGGRVQGHIPAEVPLKIEALLASPAHQRRWQAWAQERRP
ncbi:MAG: hypothetical protein N4A61_16680 [Pelagimonas sp.]|nr:hypothetical protein [Pelagimonas sp.]